MTDERNKTTRKGEPVPEMFDRIAPSYDRLNHILSLGIDKVWRKKTVRLLSRKSPSHILDIAAGTGDLTIAAAKKNTSARLVAFDPSEGMLAVAERKFRDKGLQDRIAVIKGYSEQMPFGLGEFDAVTVGFGVRNFADLRKGMCEIARVLKEGGSAYILEFSMPGNNPFGWIYRFYFRKVLPAVGRAVSRHASAYSYLNESVEEFPRPSEFSAVMKECGFNEIRIISLTFGVAKLYIGTK